MSLTIASPEPWQLTKGQLSQILQLSPFPLDGALEDNGICFDTLQISGRDLGSLETENELGQASVLGAHDLVMDGSHGGVCQQLI